MGSVEQKWNGQEAGQIVPFDFDELAEPLRSLLAPRVERLGYLGDFFRYAAHQPAALAHFIGFTECLKSALSDRLTELVALTVATRKDNSYESSQHQRRALALGLAPEWVAAVCSRARDLPVLAPGEQAVRSLALALSDGDNAAAQRLLPEVVRQWDQPTAVGVLLLIARFLAHAAVSAALDLQAPVPYLAKEAL